MGIVVTGAGCEVGGRVQGESRELSCHGVGLGRLRVQEDEVAAGEGPRTTAPSLMDIPTAPQGRQSPGG